MTFLVLMAIPACRGAEISLFKLTGVDGFVLLDFLRDAFTSGSSKQTQNNLSEQVMVMTHSYVYHPNFLTLDIGGGPIRQDISLDVNGSDTSAGKTQYNFTAHANFLSGKPVNGSVFYDHLNPTVQVAPGEIMVQESDRYGFNFSMSNTDYGLPINLGYVHSRTQGSSAGRVVDDELEQFNFNISYGISNLGSTNFHFQSSDQTSRSGSLSLPIQASTSTTQSANLNTRLQLGSDHDYDLTNNIYYNRRQYSLGLASQPDQNDFGFLLDLRHRASEKTSFYGTYNLSSNDQGLTSQKLQSLTTGVSYQAKENLDTNLSVKVEQNEASQYTLRSNSIDGNVRYKTSLRPGNLSISYGARYEQRNQQATSPLVSIIDEQHTLSGFTQATLNNLHVVSGSLVVTNQLQTQTYVENVDYLVVVVGAETRIQRLVGGNIIDGSIVLVDYTYDIGGSYASSQLDQTLNINWNIVRNIEAYFRLFDSRPQITSGFSTFQLNDVRDILLGIRAEIPVNSRFSLGGSLESQDRDETISPYRRLAGDLYLQTSEPVFDFLNMRLSGRRSIVKYSLSSQDQDVTGYELRLWARRYGIDFNGSANYEEDSGSPVPNKRQGMTLNAVWRKRKVTVTAGYTYSHESQGSYSRDQNTVHLTARRDF